jgi:tetratricopeptide (TPR) repeat protein
MFEPFLAFFGRLLGSLVSPAVGLYRQFSAERKAGENPESVRVDNADEILDAALRRIGSPSEPDSLMQDFAASTTAAYTRPDHLNKPHVRDWLALPGNSEAFKRIAKSALVGAPEPSDQRRKLISSYSAVSGEAEHLGESAVSTILAILKAAVQSSTSDSGASGIIQIGFASVHDQLKKMGKPHDSFDAQASVYFANQIIEIHRDQAREQLDKILKRRSSPRRETLSELKELSSALSIDGRLAAAPKDVKIEVHNWIARISAATGNLSEAEKSIQFIQGSGFAVSDIVLAWMNVAENKAEIALQNLRSKTDPDSRSNIFVILRRTKSLSDALTYFRSFQPHQYEHFTPFGWHAICASLLEASEYAEALEIVQWLPAETFSGCIAFGYLRGLVLALQFVPEDHRARAIDDPLAVVNHCLEGGEATEWRKRARDAFSEAQITATASSDDAVAQACEDWIRVIDFSDPATKEQTIARLRLDMMDPINAVRLIRCAITFEVSIDTTALEIHLAKLEQLGGPNGDELIATLFLLQHKNQHAEAAKFIQSRWSRLIEFARPAALAGARIEALIKAGECDSASMALEELKNFIYKPDLPRHRLMIDDCKGQDPTQRAKENFEASQAIEDLWNLVFVLRAKKRWSDLVPYARLLAKRETTAEAVTILVTGLQNSNAPPKEIVAVLEHYRELIELDHNLNSIHAWALYHLGKIFQAKDINDKLLRERSAANDIGLDANIAIRLGDWDRFTDVLSAAWGRRNELPVQLTLQVAKLAGSRAPERALQLCEEAVKRDPGNPALLIRAHGIAMSLARDDLALPWIHQAAELSTDDNGPIKKLSSRAEIISMLVSQADDWRRKNELFREGKIPLHWAASMLNVPLTKLLVSIPAENRAKADARRKYPIPVRSGGRKEVDISKVKKLGLDITSVFFLSGIGLLEQTIENFEEIYLSPRVMENLLLEREKIGFHQPSRIERSKKLLELRRSGKISVAEALANSTLAVEVGPEAASLLTLAKKN